MDSQFYGEKMQELNSRVKNIVLKINQVVKDDQLVDVIDAINSMVFYYVSSFKGEEKKKVIAYYKKILDEISCQKTS